MIPSQIARGKQKHERYELYHGFSACQVNRQEYSTIIIQTINPSVLQLFFDIHRQSQGTLVDATMRLQPIVPPTAHAP